MSSRFKHGRNQGGVGGAVILVGLFVTSLAGPLRAQDDVRVAKKPATVWNLALTGGPSVGKEDTQFEFKPAFAGDVDDVGLPSLAVRVTGRTAQGESLTRGGDPDRKGTYRVRLPLGAYTAVARVARGASKSDVVAVDVVGLQLETPERLGDNQFRFAASRRGGRVTGPEEVHVYATPSGGEAKRYEGKAGVPLEVTFDREGEYSVWASMIHRGLVLSSPSRSISVTLPPPKGGARPHPDDPIALTRDDPPPLELERPRPQGKSLWGMLLAAIVGLVALGFTLRRLRDWRARGDAAANRPPASPHSTISSHVIGGEPTLHASAPPASKVKLNVTNPPGTVWIARQYRKEHLDGTAPQRP